MCNGTARAQTHLLFHSFLVYYSRWSLTEVGSDLISGQSMWHLQWKMWQSSRLSAKSFHFCCQHHSTNAPHSNWLPHHQCYLILTTDKITIQHKSHTSVPPSHAHSNSELQKAILNISVLLIFSFPKTNSDMHKYSIRFQKLHLHSVLEIYY